MLIYLDTCCFNRPFDDQSQLFTRIARKASALLRLRSAPVRAGMDSAANEVRLMRLAFVAVLYTGESR